MINSFNDSPPLTEASRESIRSFWIGCTGLAFLAHIAIYLTVSLQSSIIDWFRNWRPAKTGLLAVYCISLGILFTANGLFTSVRQNSNNIWRSWVQPQIMLEIIVSALGASLMVMIFLIVVGLWLRICGWRMHERQVS